MIRQCRNCGKDYEVCAAAFKIDSVFNWKTVACSPDCAEEYFRAIKIARGELTEDEKAEVDGVEELEEDEEYDHEGGFFAEYEEETVEE